MKTTYYYWPTPPYEKGRQAVFDSDQLTITVNGSEGGLDSELHTDLLVRHGKLGRDSKGEIQINHADAQAVYDKTELEFSAHFPTLDPSKGQVYRDAKGAWGYVQPETVVAAEGNNTSPVVGEVNP